MFSFSEEVFTITLILQIGEQDTEKSGTMGLRSRCWEPTAQTELSQAFCLAHWLRSLVFWSRALRRRRRYIPNPRNFRRLAQSLPSPLGVCATCLENRTTQLRLPIPAQAHTVALQAALAAQQGFLCHSNLRLWSQVQHSWWMEAQISAERITKEKGCHRTTGKHMLPDEFLQHKCAGLFKNFAILKCLLSVQVHLGVYGTYAVWFLFVCGFFFPSFVLFLFFSYFGADIEKPTSKEKYIKYP